jgi:hypothetical protein
MLLSFARDDLNLPDPRRYKTCLGVFHSGVVRTFRSAVSGRPEGLHYIGAKAL